MKEIISGGIVCITEHLIKSVDYKFFILIFLFFSLLEMSFDCVAFIYI